MKIIDFKVFDPDEAKEYFTFNRFDISSGAGYQRQVSESKISKMVKACIDNKGNWPFPPVNVVLNNDKTIEVIEGQHRSLAGIISRTKIPTAVWDIKNEAARAEAFVVWNQGTKPSGSHIIAVSNLGPRLKAAFNDKGIVLNTKSSWSSDVIDYRNATYFISCVMGREVKAQGTQALIDFGSKRTDHELNTFADEVVFVRSTFIDNRTKPETNLLRVIMDLHGRISLSKRDIIKICEKCERTDKQRSAVELTQMAVLFAYNFNKRDHERLSAWPAITRNIERAA